MCPVAEFMHSGSALPLMWSAPSNPACQKLAYGSALPSRPAVASAFAAVTGVPAPKHVALS
jgi:hypothetical protein